MKAYNLEVARQYKDQVTELFLHGLGMTECPELLFELPQLQVLCLSENRLQELPEKLTSLRHLKTLDLSGNALSSLPKQLANLSSLAEVNLSDNQFSRFPLVLGKLPNLQHLDLSANKLRSLPKNLSNTQNFRILRLSDNRLRELPVEWSPPLHLRELRLDQNHLSVLPDWVWALSEMEVLSLAHNRLSELPTIRSGQLPKLEILNLRHNALARLPHTIGNLRSLQRLWLDRNLLTELPLQLEKLSALRQLSCQGNQLKLWPVHLGLLPRLESLELGHNQLHFIPDSPGKWPVLQQLGLQSNALSELPDAFGRLPRLKELHLGRNRFTHFPEMLVTSSSLEKVSGVAGASKAIRFMQACQKADLPEACCVKLFRLCGGDMKPEAIPMEDLLLGLRLSLPSLQKAIRAFLFQREDFSLDPSKAVFGLLGRTRLPKSAWKERLEKVGIQLTESKGREPTHLVLGGGSVEIPENWLQGNITFLEESTLFQYIQDKEKSYLHKMEDHGQLVRLLQSKQPDSLRLALALLKNGGVPPAVMTDLYLAWKGAPEVKLKKAFRDLLHLYASESGRRFLEIALPFQSPGQLREACMHTEFDADRIWASFQS